MRSQSGVQTDCLSKKVCPALFCKEMVRRVCQRCVANRHCGAPSSWLAALMKVLPFCFGPVKVRVCRKWLASVTVGSLSDFACRVHSLLRSNHRNFRKPFPPPAPPFLTRHKWKYQSVLARRLFCQFPSVVLFFFFFLCFFTKSFLASQEVRNRYKEQYKGVRIWYKHKSTTVCIFL